MNLAQFAEWMPKLREAKFTLSATYKSQFLLWIADDSFRLHKWSDWAATFNKTKIQQFFQDCSKGTDAALFALETTVLFRTMQDVQAQDRFPTPMGMTYIHEHMHGDDRHTSTYICIPGYQPG